MDPVQLGFNDAMNVTIFERRTDWGRCYTIMVRGGQNRQHLYFELDHRMARNIGRNERTSLLYIRGRL